MATAAEQSMALKVMNQILGKQASTTPKPQPKTGKQKRDEKREEKDADKTIKSVAISSHQRVEGNKEVLTSPSAICDAVFSPRPNLHRGETPVVAVDCEMVGVDGNQDALARVSIVNYNGHVIMDKYVIPDKRITDFRSWVSGVYPYHLKIENGAITFKEAKKMSHRILKDKIIAGHSLNHDFKVLDFTPPEEDGKLRDLTRFTKYKNQFGQIRSLKNLALDLLGKKIQQGEHSSVTDAQASIGLYRLYERDWENHVK